MIYIDRNRQDGQGRPIRPTEAWFADAAQWTGQAEREGPGHVILERVYRHDSVRRALEALFHRKCAYCETPLTEVGWDIEHFRPKGKVTERPEHPGYYWLAYTWSNLYPSCGPCNKRLKDQATWEEPKVGKTAGKANQFPLAREADRAMAPAAKIDNERPLLLDPCADRPEEHLRFTPIGEIEAHEDDPRAAASIDVFHLTRRHLRDRRKEQILLVVLLLKALRDFEATNPTKAKTFEAEIEEKIFADSSPFAAAARHVRRDPDAFGV